MLGDDWNKVHILGMLAVRFGLTRYLEITTTTTGGRYPEARELQFDVCKRLIYRHDGAMRDSLPVDYASPDEDIDTPIAAMKAAGERFDIILVDAHHTYECAFRDLEVAYGFLEPGGAIVVHDCNPMTKAQASPEFIAGEWCGVSYKAFIDFVITDPRFDYFTIDADYGCGVILRPRKPLDALRNRIRASRRQTLAQRWRAAGHDNDATFAMFDAERRQLLRLGGFDLLRRKLG